MYATLLVALPIVVTLALSWVSWVYRVAALRAVTLNHPWSDLRGFASDCLVALLIALATCLVRGRRALAAVFAFECLALGLLGLINYEHVLDNGNAVDFRMAKVLTNATFFKGSVMHFSNLDLMALAVLPALALWLVMRKAPLPPRRALAGASLVVLPLMALELVNPASLDAQWRYHHVIAENAASFLMTATHDEPVTDDSLVGDALVERRAALGLASDLSGASRLTQKKRAKNVLVVMMEAMSGGYLTRPVNEGSRAGLMPKLSAIAERGIQYELFYAHQRQTNRGEYAVLCGDLPNLAQQAAKMDLFTQLQHRLYRECLPGLLKDAGYQTAYLQTAPMAFMNKDQFMPTIGFEHNYDNQWLKDGYVASGWGIDDKAFFEQAAQLVGELGKDKSRPWFLTLMTAGTHHPYPVPESWKGRSGIGPFEDSVLYLDDAIAAFIDTLKARGVLDDTLVILTADESAGFGHADPLLEELSQNWLPMVALAPQEPPALVSEPYAQSDVAVSILDYLGLTPHEAMTGRSLFRHYDRARPFRLANAYSRKVMEIGADGDLLICDAKLAACRQHHLARPHPFLGETSQVATDPARIEQLRALLAVSDSPHDLRPTIGKLELISPRELVIKREPKKQYVFSSPYAAVEQDEKVRVHLKAKVVKGRIRLLNDIAKERGEIIHELDPIHLAAGMSVDLEYDLVPSKTLEDAEFRLYADAEGQSDATIAIEEATLVHGDANRGDRPGLWLRRLAISTPSDELAYDGFDHFFSSTAPCLASTPDGGMDGQSCEGDALVYGPYLSFSKGTRLRATYRVAARQASWPAFIDLVTDKGKKLLAKTDKVIVGGETTELTVEHELTEPVSDLEIRLRFEPPPGGASVTVKSAQVEARFPSAM